MTRILTRLNHRCPSFFYFKHIFKMLLSGGEQFTYFFRQDRLSTFLNERNSQLLFSTFSNNKKVLLIKLIIIRHLQLPADEVRKAERKRNASHLDKKTKNSPELLTNSSNFKSTLTCLEYGHGRIGVECFTLQKWWCQSGSVQYKYLSLSGQGNCPLIERCTKDEVCSDKNTYHRQRA